MSNFAERDVMSPGTRTGKGVHVDYAPGSRLGDGQGPKLEHQHRNDESEVQS